MALACFAAGAQPANDDANKPMPLMIAAPGAFDNTGATAQAGEVSPGPGSPGPGGSCNQQDGWCAFETGVQNSVWFTFEAPDSGCVDIATDNTLDLQLAVWDASDFSDFGTFVELAANDDSGPSLSPFISNLQCLVPDRTYWIQLDGFSGLEGKGNLTVTECVADVLTVDAGDCQTRLLNDGDDVNDVNYLVPTIDGGVATTCTWGVSVGDGDSILLQSGCSLAVQPDTATTYCVDVTDATGCTVSDCVTVQAIDVVCHQNGKVVLCHVPPGNPDNPQQLCIDPSAVGDHLDNHEGDAIGSCDCTAANPAFAPCVDLTVDLLTDAFGGETSWELIDLDAGFLIDSRAPGSLESNTAHSDTYCVDPAHCYESTFHDSFGDGICCLFGQGNYSITFGGDKTLSPSGGAFGSTETVLVGACPLQASAPLLQAQTVAAQNPDVVATGFVIRDQLGTVSAIADAQSVTESLPPGASGSISATAGKLGSNYGMATATTALKADLISVALTADVGQFGNDGAAKGRVVEQFSVEQDTRYDVPLATTEVIEGKGSLGERAFIVLSNDDGVIFRKEAGDDAIRCNPEHPNFGTLCEKRTLTPGAYALELQASAYAPVSCDRCSSLAVKAKSEVKFITVP